MVKISALLILILALVCFTIADKGTGGHGGSPSDNTPEVPQGNSTAPGNSTSSSSASESSQGGPVPISSQDVESSASASASASSESNESPYDPKPHNQTFPTTGDSSYSESEHNEPPNHGGIDGSKGGDDEDSKSDDSKDDSNEIEPNHGGDDDDSSDDHDNDYRPHGKYFHVRVIVVVSLEDIIALSNRTVQLRHSLAEIFNISEKFISIHFRLHGLHDISSELAESSDESSSDDSGEKHNQTASTTGKSNEPDTHKPGSRGDKKFFEIIIDVRVPVENANQHVTSATTVQTNMNTTLSNPQSGLSRTLAASGAQAQSTATSKVTQVTPSNSTSNSTSPSSSSTTSPVVIDIGKLRSSGTSVKATAMMMLAGLAALIL